MQYPPSHRRETIRLARIQLLESASQEADKCVAKHDQVVTQWNLINENTTAATSRAKLHTIINNRSLPGSRFVRKVRLTVDCEAVTSFAPDNAHIIRQIAHTKVLYDAMPTDDGFRRAMNEHTWSAQMCGVFRMLAAGCWETKTRTFIQPVRSNWDPINRFLQGLAVDLIPVAGDDPEISMVIQLLSVLEILDGPGMLQDKHAVLATGTFHFEVEDCLATSGMWNRERHCIMPRHATDETSKTL